MGLPLVQLFRRIMASARHKQQHNFRLSYQLEVGSSVDPDMEDISHWEHELQGQIPIAPLDPNAPTDILISFTSKESYRSSAGSSRRF